jgi:hypothetical protein
MGCSYWTLSFPIGKAPLRSDTMPTTPSCTTIVNDVSKGGQQLAAAITAFFGALGKCTLIDIVPTQDKDGVASMTLLTRPSTAGVTYLCAYLRALPSESLDDIATTWSLASGPVVVHRVIDITKGDEKALQEEILILYSTDVEEVTPPKGDEQKVVAVLNSTAAPITTGSTGTFTPQLSSGASTATITARNMSGTDWAVGVGGYATFDVLAGEWLVTQA